jgi:hypothetical protein
MGQGEQDWIKADNFVDLACRNRSAFQHIHFAKGRAASSVIASGRRDDA